MGCTWKYLDLSYPLINMKSGTHIAILTSRSWHVKLLWTQKTTPEPHIMQGLIVTSKTGTELIVFWRDHWGTHSLHVKIVFSWYLTAHTNLLSATGITWKRTSHICHYSLWNKCIFVYHTRNIQHYIADKNKFYNSLILCSIN